MGLVRFAFPLMLALSILGCVRHPSAVAPGSVAPVALADTSWILVSGPVSMAPGDRVVFRFTGDGRVGISGLCNQIGGRYLHRDGHVEFQDMISTMVACTDDRKMRLESEVGRSMSGALPVEAGSGQDRVAALRIGVAPGQSWIFERE